MNSELKTDNELIAEFMGIKEVQTHFDDRIDNAYCWWTANEIYRTCSFTVPGKSFLEFVNQSRYHTSWNWLMPVVEKIESIAPNRVVIDCNECRIVADRRFKVHTLKKINSVYQCVVQFIKWYNENKSVTE